MRDRRAAVRTAAHRRARLERGRVRAGGADSSCRMIFGIFEFGRAIWTQGMLDYAVEQASRCASINTTTCGSRGRDRDLCLAADLAAEPAGLGCSPRPRRSCGNQVSASYAFTFVAPELLPYNITLTSQSCYPDLRARALSGVREGLALGRSGEAVEHLVDLGIARPRLHRRDPARHVGDSGEKSQWTSSPAVTRARPKSRRS